MWAIVACFCLLLLSLQGVLAEGENSWFNPSDPGPSNNFAADLVFAIGDKFHMQWTTTLDAYDIALFQQGIDPASGTNVGTIYSTSSGSGEQSYTWTVTTLSSNLTFSPVYFFWLDPSLDGYTSHYFNITQPASSTSYDLSTSSATSTASTTTSSSTASTLATTTSSSTITTQSTFPSTISSTTSSPASASATSSPSTSPSSDNTALKVGLGVGLGVGIPLVLIAGVYLGLKIAKQIKAASKGGDNDSSHPLAEVAEQKYADHPSSHPEWRNEAPYQDSAVYEAPVRHPRPAELVGMRDPAELQGSEAQRDDKKP